MSGDLAFVGFGEAGQAFAGSVARAGRVLAFDVDPGRAAAMRALDVLPVARADLSGAGLVWSLVTADRAGVAAAECAGFLAPGALWLDGNSCSPGAKARAAAIIGAGQGQSVDVAIMAPVHPLRAAVPLLLAGPRADEAAERLRALGMNPSVVGDRVGQASTIKMLRSVMIKGIEALTAECLLAARKAGVDDTVLASLQRSDPGFDWTARSGYNLERMAVHGRRRAAEMREVAQTLRDLDLPDRMAAATALWQEQIAALGAPMEDGFAARADALLAALRR